MPKPDGGAAFPTLEFFDEGCLGVFAGLTKRDYFAAHAPIQIGSWFVPRMESPEPADAEKSRAWRDEYFKQWALQWPYAWADAMLLEREK